MNGRVVPGMYRTSSTVSSSIYSSRYPTSIIHVPGISWKTCVNISDLPYKHRQSIGGSSFTAGAGLDDMCGGKYFTRYTTAVVVLL